MILGLALAAAASDDLAERLAVAREAAEAVQIDGLVEDWNGLYAAKGRGALRALAIAPLEDRLLVRVDAAPGPLRLFIDAVDGPPMDVVLQLDGRLTVRPVDAPERDATRLTKAEVSRRGRAVELSVPWASLGLVGSPMPFVRVRARHGDDRLAVASPRLTDPPPLWDPPSPQQAPLVVDLPVDGRWWVAQGPMSAGTHRGVWAVDLVVREAWSDGRAVGGPERSPSFGRPVWATGAGRVRVAIDGFPDRPYDDPGKGSEANRVALDLDVGVRMVALHLREGSVAVSPKERVRAGHKLGEVGNSGHSTGPHLHLLFAGKDGRGAPFAFQDVWVGLNPSPDDPWRRRVDAWSPSVGFFVERATPRDAAGR